MRYLYILVIYASLAVPASAAQVAFTVHSTEIKQQPYSDAQTVATLNDKSSVEVLSRRGGWVNISSSKGKGWVRMLSLRSDSTAQKRGDSGLQSLINVGRSGSSGITVATGVRGLSEEDLKNAHPNPVEFEKLQKYAANRANAEKFAHDAKLKTRQLEYLPSGGNP
ncbi:MAG: SH3 domain-containing protein [Gallionella sp.]